MCVGERQIRKSQRLTGSGLLGDAMASRWAKVRCPAVASLVVGAAVAENCYGVRKRIMQVNPMTYLTNPWAYALAYVVFQKVQNWGVISLNFRFATTKPKGAGANETEIEWVLVSYVIPCVSSGWEVLVLENHRVALPASLFLCITITGCEDPSSRCFCFHIKLLCLHLLYRQLWVETEQRKFCQQSVKQYRTSRSHN